MPDTPKPPPISAAPEGVELRFSLYFLQLSLAAMLWVSGPVVLFWTGIDALALPVEILAWSLLGTLGSTLFASLLVRGWLVQRFARVADSTFFKVCFLVGGLGSLGLLSTSDLVRLIPKLFLCALIWLSFHWLARKWSAWQVALWGFAGWAKGLAVRLLSPSSSLESASRVGWKAPVLALALILVCLVPHEWMVRTHLWTGGFMVEVGADRSLQALREAKIKPDLVVFGSSRAKESIRPQLIGEGLEEIERPINHAGHSLTSTDQVYSLAAALRSEESPGSIGSPAYLVCTVEPLHFTETNVIYIRKQAKDTALSVSAFEGAQEANREIQAWLSARCGEAAYAALKSASPTQRRKLPLWGGFFYDAGRRLLREGPAAIPDSYSFNIIDRQSRWFTRVVERQLGYEGHVLYLSRGATRVEAFAGHKDGYVHQIFPAISDRFFPQFRLDLQTIKAAGTRILLLRLPIYRELYEAEERAWPEFSQHIARIGSDLGISYVDMNAGVAEEFCKDPNSFTDGSHMEHGRTSKFHEFLLPVLRQELLEPK